MFDKFVQVVNGQRYFNINGEINAIPIIGYYEIKTEAMMINLKKQLFNV